MRFPLHIIRCLGTAFGRLSRAATLSLFCAIYTCSSAALHIRLTDVELADSPVIVVGYWSKPEIKTRIGLTAASRSTTLKVTRVLRGNIAPGPLKVALFGIGWDDDGKEVISGTTSISLADVDDVTRPNIWFLKMNSTSSRPMLQVTYGESVQSAHLLPYYQVLMRKDREATISRCLLSNDSLIVNRSLQFVSDWKNPWPLRFAFIGKRRLLLNQRPNVERVITHGPLLCRAYATALYAEMTGPSAIPKLRQLCQDPNADVAATAACYLVKFRDSISINRIKGVCQRNIIVNIAPARVKLVGDKATQYSEAERRRNDSVNVCRELAFEMGRSQNNAFVPALCQLLNCGTSSGLGFVTVRVQNGNTIEDDDEPNAPAAAAQSGLRELTGVTFPFDSRVALSAWESSRAVPEQQRLSFLRDKFNEWEHPLTATWQLKSIHPTNSGSDDGDNAVATILNTTQHPIYLSRQPTIMLNTGSVSMGAGGGGVNDFVILKRGESITFPLTINHQVLNDPTLSVELIYEDLGRHHRAMPWIGRLNAQRTGSRR